MATEDTSSAAFDPLKTIETYIDGKMRRYTLLFAVNGGAFAIAQLFKDQGNSPSLGALSVEALAIGAVLFSWLMWIDIWAWGEMMRRYFNTLCPKAERSKLGLEVFTYAGKAILTLLVLLVTGGWLLAANSCYAVAVSTISLGVVVGLVEGAKYLQPRQE